jgi:hypothetical protein
MVKSRAMRWSRVSERWTRKAPSQCDDDRWLALCNHERGVSTVSSATTAAFRAPSPSSSSSRWRWRAPPARRCPPRPRRRRQGQGPAGGERQGVGARRGRQCDRLRARRGRQQVAPVQGLPQRDLRRLHHDQVGRRRTIVGGSHADACGARPGRELRATSPPPAGSARSTRSRLAGPRSTPTASPACIVPEPQGWATWATSST